MGSWVWLLPVPYGETADDLSVQQGRTLEKEFWLNFVPESSVHYSEAVRK